MKIIVQANEGERRYRLESFPCRLGRSKSCEIVVPDSSISSHHATVKQGSDGCLYLVDNDSTNGVYRGTERVQRVPLRGETDLLLGSVPVRFQPEQGEDNKAGKTRQGTGGDVSATDERKCYYRDVGREFGPVSVTELRSRIARGDVQENDLVWLEGSTSWVKASRVPGLLRNESADQSAKPPPEKSTAAKPPNASKQAGAPKDASAAEGAEASAAKPAGARSAASPPAHRPVTAATSSRGEITCPHCWHSFNVEEFLYIARHQSLVGDPVL
ncbi:MAG: FHA domain-containing protein, partial [bacterium]